MELEACKAGKSKVTQPLKAAKYEIQKPLTCRTTLFRCKFWVDVGIFHLA